MVDVNRLVRVLGLLAGLALVGGCATVPRLEPGTGAQLSVEGRSYDQVWFAALDVVARHLRISVGTNKQLGTIRAERSGGWLPGSEAVGVFVRPPNAPSDRYVVEVVSRRSGIFPFAIRNWEPVILEDLKKSLNL
jgi:hypothetical protein